MSEIRCVCSITDCANHPSHGDKYSHGEDCFYAELVNRVDMDKSGAIVTSLGSRGAGLWASCRGFKRCGGCPECQPLPDWAKDEDPESKSS